MADQQPLNRLGDFLRDERQWYQLPQLLAMVRLIEIRNELRAKNLHDTEEPALAMKPIPPNLDPALRKERTLDGTYNDLDVPADGRRRPPLRPQRPARARVSRQGESIRAESARRQPRADDARHVQAGDDSQPARRRVDPVHGARLVRAQAIGTRPTASRSRSRRATTGPTPRCACRAVVPDAAPAGSTRPPAYTNPNSHWWDASQVYGCEQALCASLRTTTAAS